MSRIVHKQYHDPLDLVWRGAARRMGVEVVRTTSSYASYDGRGTLSLSDAQNMDADDCLAQMILHEFCHALVQGPQSFGWVDWGLDNETDRDVEREQACLRLQAALLDPYGLRQVLAPTTDFRTFYDELDADPFVEQSEKDRTSIIFARAAWSRQNQRPFRGEIESALERTAGILELVTEDPAASALRPPSLLHSLRPRSELHPSGQPRSAAPGAATCGNCAWLDESRCGKTGACGLHPTEPACRLHEAPFDCLGCGACCREAYDTVEVAPDEPAARLHLPLLVKRAGGYDMKREGTRCHCLQGGSALAAPRPAISGGSEADDAAEKLPPQSVPGPEPFTCSIYETRPQTCRDFSILSEHCLSARRRVGLSL